MNRHVRRLVAASTLSVATALGGLLLGTGLVGEERPPAPPALTVVGLGDSVMAGTACDCSGIAAEYAADWGRRIGRTVRAVNLGVSGDTTTTLATRLATDDATRTSLRRADVVLVVEGANDLVPQLQTWQASSCPASCYDPAVAAMGSRLDQSLDVIRQLAPRGAQVIVAGYWNVFEDGEVARSQGGQAQVDWSRALTRVANAAIAAASRRERAVYVDLTAAFDSDDDWTDLLADDGDHPNQAGVTRIVHTLLEATTLPSR